MNYLRGRLIIAKYIIFNRGIRLLFETIIASIFTDSLTWLSIVSWLFKRKYNSLLTCFCKIEIPIKFAINGIYYTYVTIIERKSF